MATPSRHEKAKLMAAAFGEFTATTMAMVQFIEKMHGVVTKEDASDEEKEAIEGIATFVEASFKQALTPYIGRLKQLEAAIREMSQKHENRILTPDDPDFPV